MNELGLIIIPRIDDCLHGQYHPVSVKLNPIQNKTMPSQAVIVGYLDGNGDNLCSVQCWTVNW